MGRLIYSAIVSLDGYVADDSGRFDWAMPDETVHSFLNDLERSVGTYLYGRRMYGVMAVWEDMDSAEYPPYIREFATTWKSADKIVYSRSLSSPSTPRTRIESHFDAEAVRHMKADCGADLSIGGPTIAAAAIEAGLVDEYNAVVVPVVVGGGLRFFPNGARLDLGLLGERRFENGMVFLRYGASAG